MRNEERFWKKVMKTESCWIWTDKWRDKDGYANFRYFGKTCRAHRISYILTKGPIPDGLQLDHLCRVRDCVNPDHLEPVTNNENNFRGIGITATNARKTECIRGHKFVPGSYHKYGNKKSCKECLRIRHYKYQAIRKGLLVQP